MATWMLKTEPETFSWDDLVKEKGTSWSGVRNYTARIHLRAMRQGDRCFIYHSGGPKQVVGIATVSREQYPDPTIGTDDPELKKGWVAVDIQPVQKLKTAVGLDALKAHKLLSKMVFVKQSRLSVSPVSEAEAKALLSLAG